MLTVSCSLQGTCTIILCPLLSSTTMKIINFLFAKKNNNEELHKSFNVQYAFLCSLHSADTKQKLSTAFLITLFIANIISISLHFAPVVKERKKRANKIANYLREIYYLMYSSWGFKINFHTLFIGEEFAWGALKGEKGGYRKVGKHLKE